MVFGSKSCDWCHQLYSFTVHFWRSWSSLFEEVDTIYLQ
uniref:Uncharacterized protein n=1 Tax=Arundo donax TaxID=35708 RepID=A0A0A9E820_ARUDO